MHILPDEECEYLVYESIRNIIKPRLDALNNDFSSLIDGEKYFASRIDHLSTKD